MGPPAYRYRCTLRVRARFKLGLGKIGPAGVQVYSSRYTVRIRFKVRVREDGPAYGRPLSRTVAASTTYGCNLHYLRLQPPLPTVAASTAYGCRLQCLRLQVLDLVEGGNAAKSGAIQKGDQLVGVTG